ncbi:MAG: hypothetical protein Q8M07_02800 [Prosthecobacter sp.]|nr:hypothetical protein [Prosthecobacter sp.]
MKHLFILFALCPLLFATELLVLMQNLDGDLSFTGDTPAESKAKLEQLVADIAKGPAKSLMWSIGAGSDILYYQTKVASTWGWRVTKYHDDPKWKARIERCRKATEAGLDAPRIAGEQAKKHGMAFYPSYRMNDAHFCSDPLHYPLTGKFWMEHQDASLGASPVPQYEGYKHLLNYARDEVQVYRLAIIFEAMDRYADVMDGFELDFNRFQIFFPPGTAAKNAPLMTELVEKARQHLESIAIKQQRPLKLIARVPPSLKNCEWSGLDIAEWMRRRLLDAIIPAQVMTLSHDMPIDEFVRIAKPAGCEVIGSLYGRSGYIWPFSPQHDADAYSAEVSRTPTAAQFLGAALNQRHLGASGHQIYNLVLHSQPGIVQALGTQQGTRRYLVTQPYFHDRDDTYENRKQLPVSLKTGEPSSLRLLIGEDASKATAWLRLGLHGANQSYADVALTIRLNGHPLHEGSAAKNIIVTTGKRHGIASCPATEAYAQWPVPVTYLQHG